MQKLFDDVAPRFAERPGGYTRIVKLGPRQGDAPPRWSTSSSSTTSPQAADARRRSAGGAAPAPRAGSRRRRRRLERGAARLELEYDGTGFRGWARPARPRARSRASVRAALDAVFPAGTASRSPAARTPASTRSRRSRASTSRAARRPDRSGRGAERRAARRTSPSSRPRRRRGVPRALLRASRSLPLPHPHRVARVAARGSGAAGGRARSTSDALAECAALLLGEHEFRAFTPTRPSTRSSCATSCRRRGSAAATSSTSRSPPTRSSATWCGRSSGTMLERGPDGSRRLLAGAPRAEAGDDRAAVGLLSRALEYGQSGRASPSR